MGCQRQCHAQTSAATGHGPHTPRRRGVASATPTSATEAAMSRKKTRRKVYQLVNPIEMAIQGATITPNSQLDKLRALELSSIDAIARGLGTIHDLESMRDMLNLAETMARGGIGHEVLAPCEKAQAELISMVDRFNRTGRIGATGPGLEAFREAFRWHDLQRTSIDRSEYERYIVKTANALRAGKATVLTVDITPK